MIGRVILSIECYRHTHLAEVAKLQQTAGYSTCYIFSHISMTPYLITAKIIGERE